MKPSVFSIFAAAAVTLVPTVALANTSGTQGGSGNTQPAAVNNAYGFVTQDCAAHGGVQSKTVVSLTQNPQGIWIAQVQYVCNS